MPGEIALTLLGRDIPAIGPRMKNRAAAVSEVKKYVFAIEGMVKSSQRPYHAVFSRQPDGRYKLVVKGSGKSLEILKDIDQVTFKRFEKIFKSRVFIITGFFEEGEHLECLALTEGIGAVLYIPW